jgi:hypothetical protein
MLDILFLNDVILIPFVMRNVVHVTISMPADKDSQSNPNQLKHDFFSRSPAKEWTLANGVQYYIQQNVPVEETYNLL